MKSKVELSPQAEADIEELRAFVVGNDGPGRADTVLDGLFDAIRALASFPKRGHALPELEGQGLDEVLEIHHKPWRIVYEQSPGLVQVLIVADGRRDFAALLSRRILRSR